MMGHEIRGVTIFVNAALTLPLISLAPPPHPHHSPEPDRAIIEFPLIPEPESVLKLRSNQSKNCIPRPVALLFPPLYSSLHVTEPHPNLSFADLLSLLLSAGIFWCVEARGLRL
jgi:hypothetical protein